MTYVEPRFIGHFSENIPVVDIHPMSSPTMPTALKILI